MEIKSNDFLFSSDLIPHKISNLPDGYSFRPLSYNDYDKGILEVLKTLTVVGNITKEQYLKLFESWKKSSNTYYIIVIQNNKGNPVAIGSLIVEQKIIHECGKVGHIEDIAVLSSEQGKKLGLNLIKVLNEMSRLFGCYKCILDCSLENEKFYEKCGFSKKGLMMVCILEKIHN